MNTEQREREMRFLAKLAKIKKEISRYIYVAPNGDGRWKLWAEHKGETWTEETFPTMKQAIRGIPQYTKALCCRAGTYINTYEHRTTGDGK